MKYLSICSGIEAASVAFEPLGWRPLAFSEIEAFPRAVLKHHYPDTPCHGDFTKLKDEPWIVDADMLCGGTPCQAFSVAGLRQSLADDRGNLTLQFVLLADAIDNLRRAAGREPAWILWENVPGVLSTKDNAFGAFLGGLCGRDEPIAEPADGWTRAGVVDGPARVAAWRVMDAQHFGLAQRRQRVFVLALGGAGRWAAADALLPLIESSRWHPAPSRGKGKGTARGFETGPSGGRITDLAPTIDCRAKNGPIQNQLGVGVMEVVPEVTRPLTAAMGTKWNGNGDLESSLIPSVANTLRGEGFDASEDGTGCGQPIVVHGTQDPCVSSDTAFALGRNNGGENALAIAIQAGALVMAHGQANAEIVSDGEPSLTCNHEAPILMRMREGKDGGGKGPLVSEDQSLTLATGNDQVLAHFLHVNKGRPDGRQSEHDEMVTVKDHVPTLTTDGHQGSAVASGMQVRRLTPVECCRLQGFPDVREILILHVCSDHQKTSASVEEKSPKLQELAEPASQSKSTESAAFAESHFSASRPKISKHAEVLVEINFEAGTIKGTIQGRELFASAPIADKERRTFLQTPLGSFAQLVARTISEQRRTQRTNAQSGPDSLMDESGNPAVSVSGNAIMECAKNAEELERIKSTSSMFTTLQVGSDTRKGDLPMTTLCSYVVAAIAGFIPSEMWSENFCIRIEARWDYLDITYRGKAAADGPKYRALGNSWAVPVVRWIGERIKAIRP